MGAGTVSYTHLPWFLEPWIKTARENYEVHYIILRAGKDETMKRAVERSKLSMAVNIQLVETMWGQFNHLDSYEANVINLSLIHILTGRSRNAQRPEHAEDASSSFSVMKNSWSSRETRWMGTCAISEDFRILPLRR